jgi:hypothetical protein
MNQYPDPSTSGLPRTEGLAITSLVLGILSLAGCNIFTGIPAIICGHVSRSRIEGSNGALAGGGMAIAGLVLGYLSIALLVLMIAGLVVMGVGFAAAIPGFQKALAAPALETVKPGIIAACEQYRAEKGQFPAVTMSSGEQVDSQELFAILTAPGGSGKAYYDTSGSGIHVNGTPRDPWNEVIQVALDLNGDGKVNLNGTMVDGSVVIWSKGANKINEFGGGDDVKTW